MRYVLVNRERYDVARAESAELLLDAAAARAIVAAPVHGTDAEWRVYFVLPDGSRRLRYGVSVDGGIYEVDGSGVPATVAATLRLWLDRPASPSRVPLVDDDGYARTDPKHPDYERTVTP